MNCPNCGKDNPDGATFCSSCGTQLKTPDVESEKGVTYQGRRIKTWEVVAFFVIGLILLARFTDINVFEVFGYKKDPYAGKVWTTEQLDRFVGKDPMFVKQELGEPAREDIGFGGLPLWTYYKVPIKSEIDGTARKRMVLIYFDEFNGRRLVSKVVL